MCVNNLEKSKRKVIFGYRFYKDMSYGTVSLYDDNPITPIGERVEAKDEKWYIFTSIRKVKKYLKEMKEANRGVMYCRYVEKILRCYKVKLEENIEIGDWQHLQKTRKRIGIKAAQGSYLTILEEIKFTI